MPSLTLSKTSILAAEEHVAQVRKNHLIGRFKILLSQTGNHVDQRPLDEEWVAKLMTDIGSPDKLNRAVHPIAAVLPDDEHLEALLAVSAASADRVPDLPEGVKVLVFSGQHRMAMLQRLEMSGPQERWWHGDVYSHRLELDHPGEFVTMMHESNATPVIKPADDTDLFKALIKLGSLVACGTIDKQSFVTNRRAVVRCNSSASRGLSNLSRNNELAEAVADALGRPHVAKQFSAGSWKRLTTGRIYGIAACLVREMSAQVDLLTEGMVEVPDKVMSITSRQCSLTSLRGQLSKAKRKNLHPWGALPGGGLEAMSRATARPATFKSWLNPDPRDGWSLPDLILLPSCMGSSAVEDELKLVQKAMQHLVKMIGKDGDPTLYNSFNPDMADSETGHPEGFILQLLSYRHKDIQDKGKATVHKIMVHVWKNRVPLMEDVELLEVRDPESMSKGDYQRLLEESRVWWETLKLCKVRRIPWGMKLDIPKSFGGEPGEEDLGQEHSAEEAETQGADVDGDQRRPAGNAEASASSQSSRPVAHRRSSPAQSVSGLGDSRTTAGVRRKRSRGDAPERETRRTKRKSAREIEDSGSETGEGHVAAGAGAGPSARGARGGGGPRATSQEDDEFGTLDLDNLMGESEGECTERGSYEERRGADRRLDKALGDLAEAAGIMTRAESQPLTSVLEEILAAQRNGDLKEMAGQLLKKSQRVREKLARMRSARFEGDDETGRETSRSPLRPNRRQTGCEEDSEEAPEGEGEGEEDQDEEEEEEEVEAERETEAA